MNNKDSEDKKTSEQLPKEPSAEQWMKDKLNGAFS